MKFGSKFIKHKLRGGPDIETHINRQIIVDQVAAFLYSLGIVKDSQEITNIQFGELFGASEVELVPIKIYLKGGRKTTKK